jgi:hypothetical protein
VARGRWLPFLSCLCIKIGPGPRSLRLELTVTVIALVRSILLSEVYCSVKSTAQRVHKYNQVIHAMSVCFCVGTDVDARPETVYQLGERRRCGRLFMAELMQPHIGMGGCNR